MKAPRTRSPRLLPVFVSAVMLSLWLVVEAAVAQPASAAPYWSLPFPSGASWQAGSPHGTNGASLDFGPRTGTGAVVAAAAGTVRLRQCPGGPVMRVDHGGGWVTEYYHLQSIRPELAGQYVQAGTRLGDAGRTIPCGGSATFDHVHFTVLKDEVPQNANGRSIGGYTAHSDGRGAYYGYWTRNSDGVRVITNNGYAACCLTAMTVSTTFPEGSFLRAVETGRIYRVAGGAPLWLSTCVDGCVGFQNLSQSTIDAMPAVPRNGSFVRAAETGRIYRVAGGGPLWLQSCVEGCAGAVNVNQWTIDVLDHLRAVPQNGQFIRAAETGRVYRVAGGAPLWLSTCVEGCPGLVNVNQWTIDVLDHLRAVPVDGTLLRAVETGAVYEVDGGSPRHLSVCPAQGCGAAVQVNQWTIDTRDHLSP